MSFYCDYCNKEIKDDRYMDDWVYDGEHEVQRFFHNSCWQKYLRNVDREAA